MRESLGTLLRRSRLFARNGRAFCLAFDHGGQLGLIPGIEDPRAMIAQALDAGVDGIILTPGLMRRHGAMLPANPRRPSFCASIRRRCFAARTGSAMRTGIRG